MSNYQYFIFGKDRRVIQNLYWRQTACILIEKEVNMYAKIESCVRQEYIFLQDLLNLYSDTIPRELNVLPVFIFGRKS